MRGTDLVVLDRLHDELDLLWTASPGGDTRSRARRDAFTAAKTFVLDERARNSHFV